MRTSNDNATRQDLIRSWRVAAALAAAVLCIWLGIAASARASYEQVGCFAGGLPAEGESQAKPCSPVENENFSEEVQLGGLGGMAVNVTGVGGVEPGTVYAATFEGGARVAMFEPTTDGGLEFVEGWEVTEFEEPYEVCGPEGELPNGDTVHPACPVRADAGGGRVDVEVDPESGNVHVFGGFNRPEGGESEVVTYSADGGEVIGRFGTQAEGGKTIAETPKEVHNTAPTLGPLGMGSDGVVYVADDINLFETYHRLMVFAPQGAGDYAHYIYKGEVAAGGFGESIPKSPVADAAGHLYVVGKEETSIEEFGALVPAGYPAAPATPICRYDFKKGGITGMTVDPQSGEVFFFSFKAPKRMRRLGPCDEATGKFTEIEPEPQFPEAFQVAPERADLFGLAFDPGREFSATRPAGILYGGAPGAVSGEGVGKGEPGQSALGYIFTHPVELPPEVLSESLSAVTATSARLEASIDTRGFSTHYAFQYLSEAAYQEAGESFAGAKEAPPGGGSAGRSAGGPERRGHPQRPRARHRLPLPGPRRQRMRAGRTGQTLRSRRRGEAAAHLPGADPGPARRARLGAGQPGAKARRAGIAGRPADRQLRLWGGMQAGRLLPVLPDAEQPRGRHSGL